MKKKLLLLTGLIAVSVSAITISSMFSASNISLITNADVQMYGVTFNSSNNKFHQYTGNVAYDGSTTIQTDLGNDVDFSYYQVKGLASTWHVLGSGGYFYNADPIHGLSSISLSFKTNSANFQILYSYDNSFDHSESFVTSTESNTVFDFDGYYPNYFKVLNTSGSNLNIESVNISLTCINEHPTLSLTSENETMGSVSGGGVKTPGQNVTAVATPNSGYRFVGWYSYLEQISTNPSYSFTMGNEDLVYSARFTYQTYNLVIQSESESKGTVSNSSGSYDYLSNIEISASANTGYTFTGWYDGENLVSTNNPYSFSMPYSNTTYIARFSANEYDLTLNNANNTLGSITGSGTFAYGYSVTITATPNIGVSFLGWFDGGDNLVSSLASYTFSMPHEDLEYTAKFAWTPYSVSLEVNDGNMGSVSGGGSYTYGQHVELVAIPNEHHSFFGWYKGEELLSQEETYSFDMPANSLNYEARFVRNYTIELISEDENKGTVSGPTEWGAGMEVTVTANANIGYAIDYWYDEDLNELSYDASYTFTMPYEDFTLYATFTAGYTLLVTSSDNSKGIVTGGGQIRYGQKVTVSMTYVSGTFKGWYDEGGNFVSSSNPYAFTMPSNDYALDAVFMTDAEEEEAEAWNIAHGITPAVDLENMTVTYGLYPQTVIDDADLLTNLNALDESAIGSNGWYLYDNEYYAKLSATPNNSRSNVFDNGNTIVSGTTYWFKCDPITWNILSNSDGEYYLLSSVLLDAHCYYNSTSSRTIDGQTIYANNYEYSDIRTWLNDDFYNSAFALNNSYIQITTVDNSASTTNNRYRNSFTCANTEDKVFLPSYKDYVNSSYGFSTSADSNTRYCKTTDWARARGAGYSTSSELYYGPYWTRSPYSGYPYNSYSYYACSVLSDLNNFDVSRSSCSVRPGLSIKIA